jgi:hypothetical protein
MSTLTAAGDVSPDVVLAAAEASGTAGPSVAAMEAAPEGLAPASGTAFVVGAPAASEEAANGSNRSETIITRRRMRHFSFREA